MRSERESHPSMSNTSVQTMIKMTTVDSMFISLVMYRLRMDSCDVFLLNKHWMDQYLYPLPPLPPFLADDRVILLTFLSFTTYYNTIQTINMYISILTQNDCSFSIVIVVDDEINKLFRC